MRQHVAFLHTSPAHVETFDRLVKAADPAVQVEHVVAEDLLADAQRVGANDPALVERIHAAMAGAASNGAAIVVCTCSTIGGPPERASTGTGFTTARIDRAMANRAVELGPRILIVAALESTLVPTGGIRVAIACEPTWTRALPFVKRVYFERVSSLPISKIVRSSRGTKACRCRVLVWLDGTLAEALRLGLEVLPAHRLAFKCLGAPGNDASSRSTLKPRAFFASLWPFPRFPGNSDV